MISEQDRYTLVEEQLACAHAQAALDAAVRRSRHTPSGTRHAFSSLGVALRRLREWLNLSPTRRNVVPTGGTTVGTRGSGASQSPVEVIRGHPKTSRPPERAVAAVDDVGDIETCRVPEQIIPARHGGQLEVETIA